MPYMTACSIFDPPTHYSIYIHIYIYIYIYNPPSKPHSIKLGQTFQDNQPHTNFLVTWQLDQHIILDHVMHGIGEEQLIPG